MTKLLQRLFIFFIGLPLVVFFVWFTKYNHILLNIIIFFVSIIGVREMYAIFAHQLKLQPKPLIIILALIVPIFSIICATFNLPFSLTTLAFIISIIISMIYEIFFPGNDSGNLFEYSSARVANTTLILTYVGFLLSFVSRMTVWESSRWFLILFLLMVYGCDSFAWFFGIILGKNNRGFIKASPNKSIAGFIGGISTSILCGILAHYMFPEIFTSLWKVIVLGLFTSVAAIFGDLIESVFKRGSAFKDSGQVIPGRGGILDSIDSILIAAPIYYFCSKLFFGL